VLPDIIRHRQMPPGINTEIAVFQPGPRLYKKTY